MAKPNTISIHEGAQSLKRLTETQLGKLSEDEKAALRDTYLDWLDEIHDNYLMRKWTVCLLIKDTFGGSNIHQGRFMQELRAKKPNAELSRIDMKTFQRYCRAAEFCERFAITDVYHCGIYPSSIYLLTERKNADIVDKLYHKLKHKSYATGEVARFIEQEHAVATIYPEPEPKDEDILFEPLTHEKRLIPVQNNIAMDPGKGDDTSATLSASRTAYTNVDLFEEPFDTATSAPIGSAQGEALSTSQDRPAFFEEPDAAIATLEDLRPGYVGPTLVPIRSTPIGVTQGESDFVDLASVTDADLLLELASRKAFGLSDDEILTELQLLSERYGKSPLKKIPLLQKWIDIEKALIYGRKTG